MKLYHYWQSSASWRVRWALAIKGIPFESVMIDLRAGVQHSAEHRARSPNGSIPVLELDDGRRLTESVAILEYLDETHPEPPLYPRGDAWLMARTRQIVELVNAGTQPLQNPIVLARAASDDAGKRAFAAFFNERGMRALETVLGETAGRFAVGDSLSAADLCVVPQVSGARRWGVQMEQFPKVLAVEAAALATPHAAGALPANQPGAPQP